MGKTRLHTRLLLQTLCPAEVFLLLVLLVTGIISLAHFDRPDPLSLLLPHWVAVVWNISIISGALVSLGGLASLNWPLVRVGYTVLSPAAAAYALALTPYATMNSIRINIAVLLVFSLACLWRNLQITLMVRRSL